MVCALSIYDTALPRITTFIGCKAINELVATRHRVLVDDRIGWFNKSILLFRIYRTRSRFYFVSCSRHPGDSRKTDNVNIPLSFRKRLPPSNRREIGFWAEEIKYRIMTVPRNRLCKWRRGWWGESVSRGWRVIGFYFIFSEYILYTVFAISLLGGSLSKSCKRFYVVHVLYW